MKGKNIFYKMAIGMAIFWLVYKFFKFKKSIENSKSKWRISVNIFFSNLNLILVFLRTINQNKAKNINLFATAPGIINLGNTCYMNSALQCLLYTTELRYSLLHKLNSIEKITNKKLTIEFINIILQFLSVKNYINPEKFKTILGEFEAEFRGYSQNDSVKVLSFILEKLNTENRENLNNEYQLLKPKQEKESDLQASDRYLDYHLANNKSIITDVFYGQYKSSILCMNCKKTTTTFEPFSNILLPIPKLIKITIFITSLKSETRKEKIIISDNLLFFDLHEVIKKKINLSFDNYEIFIIKNGLIYEINEAEKIIDIMNNQNTFILYNEKLKGENNILIYPEIMDTKNSKGRIQPYLKFIEYDKECGKSLQNQIYQYIEDFVKLKKFTDGNTEIKIIFEEKGSKNQEFQETYNPDVSYINNNNVTKILEKGGRVIIRIFLKSNDDFQEEKNDYPIILNEKINFYDCLEFFNKSETMDNWYCEKCRILKKVLKRTEIFRLPKILIIYLRRFQMNESNLPDKVDTEVEFPVNGLDLSNFADKLANKGLFKYDLYGVSRHFGNIQSGHYTAVCKKNKTWYEFNDSYSSKIDETQINSKSAYLLFYRLNKNSN